MKFGIKRQKKVIFCYDGYKYNNNLAQDEIDLILSCEYYWIRKFNIPTKSIKEAKKALPALFEDVLPLGNYEYSCVKVEDNTFLAFAYENDKILHMLKEANFNLSKIKSIRFAQTEFDSYKENSLKSDDDSIYVYKNDILIKLPFDFMQKDEKNISTLLDTIKLSSNKIDFKFYTTILDKKLIISLAVICLLLSFINLAKYIDLSTSLGKYENKKDELKVKYNLPQTTFQMKSILSENQKDLDSQIKLKNAISDIFRLKKVSQGIKIVSVKYRKNRIELLFEGGNLATIKDNLNKNYKVISSNRIKNQTKMEIAYE